MLYVAIPFVCARDEAAQRTANSQGFQTPAVLATSPARPKSARFLRRARLNAPARKPAPPRPSVFGSILLNAVAVKRKQSHS